jgi:hypothetical protein
MSDLKLNLEIERISNGYVVTPLDEWVSDRVFCVTKEEALNELHKYVERQISSFMPELRAAALEREIQEKIDNANKIEE